MEVWDGKTTSSFPGGISDETLLLLHKEKEARTFTGSVVFEAPLLAKERGFGVRSFSPLQLLSIGMPKRPGHFRTQLLNEFHHTVDAIIYSDAGG